MKFIVASGELQKALNVVSGVISSSQSRPILENFLFDFVYYYQNCIFVYLIIFNL